MMRGSLCLKSGVLYVGQAAMTAHVRAFDLDGRELDAGFSFRAPDGGRATVDGLAIDDDHRLWVADSASASLRCFTLFGVETAHADALELGLEDERGVLGVPLDVASLGSDVEQRLVVASRGLRRHAVQVIPLSPLAGRTRSLRPEGDPNGRFRHVSRIAARDEWLYVCERGARRVQVFRRFEHHFSFRVGARFEPTALAPLPDGRCVVAVGGEASALLLVDAAGSLLARLAGSGSAEGEVLEPEDVAFEPGVDDAHARLFALDQGGDRVQVFNLEGRCYGSFPTLASEPIALRRARRGE